MSAGIPQLHPLSQFQIKILKTPSLLLPEHLELLLILGALFEVGQLPLGTPRSPWVLGCGVLLWGTNTANNKLNKNMGLCKCL